MANFDLVSLALKATCPGNEILLDDKGLPSVMVRIPRFKISDVITGGSSGTHPAFIVNGEEVDEIFISKFQNVMHNGRAYSLPGEDPRVNINFDQAKQACEAKGGGWHLMTNAEWAALALWCKKNGSMPKGNNNYGKDHADTLYEAIPANKDGDGKTLRVLTGTGPVSWSHNAEPSGIWDLNGNIYEWIGGYRTVEGEIQILANNNAASQANSQDPSSTDWKAILQNGSLVAPGTANTLKWDYTNPNPTGGAPYRLNVAIENPAADESTYGAASFESLTAKSGVTAPEILKALALFPAAAESHGGDYFYMRNKGERLAFRGGLWNYAAHAGVFLLHGIHARSHSGADIGFRSAFIPGI